MFATRMQQQQQQDNDGRIRKRASPLSQLAERLADKLRNAEYTPTKEDLDAVSKCKTEVLVSSIQYPVFFGVVAGSVSYRLRVLVRAFNVAVASVFGLGYGRRRAEYACIKHFIALDDSPIKSILVDILQRDFPDHPILREVAQRNTSHFEGDDEVWEPKFPKEGGFSGEARGLSTLGDGSAPDYGVEHEEGKLGEPRGTSRHMINRRELRLGRRQAADRRESDDKLEAHGDVTEVLVDPFNLGVWSEVEDSPSENQEKQGTARREVRRSRMTSQEKREHNRMLRELRERGQQQQQQQQPNSLYN